MVGSICQGSPKGILPLNGLAMYEIGVEKDGSGIGLDYFIEGTLDLSDEVSSGVPACILYCRFRPTGKMFALLALWDEKKHVASDRMGPFIVEPPYADCGAVGYRDYLVKDEDLITRAEEWGIDPTLLATKLLGNVPKR